MSLEAAVKENTVAVAALTAAILAGGQVAAPAKASKPAAKADPKTPETPAAETPETPEAVTYEAVAAVVTGFAKAKAGNRDIALKVFADEFQTTNLTTATKEQWAAIKTRFEQLTAGA